MKQTISAIGLGLLLTLGLVTPALADVRSELESRRMEIEAQIKQNQQRLRDASAEIKSLGKDVKSTNLNFRFDIAKMRSLVATKVFDANVDRLEKLIQRVENRRVAFVSAGASTTDVSTYVNLARGNIADAKLHVNILRSLDVSTSTLSTTTATTNWQSVKSEVKIIRDLLVKAKQNLQKAVNGLSKLQKQYKLPNMNASTTATTTDH